LKNNSKWLTTQLRE